MKLYLIESKTGSVGFRQVVEISDKNKKQIEEKYKLTPLSVLRTTKKEKLKK